MTTERSPYQPPVEEVREERAYAVAQLLTPDGVIAFNADVDPVLVRSMFDAAIDRWAL